MANKVRVDIDRRETVSKASKSAKDGLSSLSSATQGLKSDAQGLVAPMMNVKAAFAAVAGGVGAAVVAIRAVAKTAIELGTMAAEAKQTATAFRDLASSVGASSSQILEKLRAASRGTVSEMELMASASRAALYKLPLEDLDKLMGIARASAMATGESVQKMFDDIVVGIARGSPMILDNLGITIKLEDAYRKYAAQLGKTAEQLTAAEKAQALLVATIESGQSTVDRMGESLATMSSVEKIAAAQAAWANLKLELSRGMEPVVAELATRFSTLAGAIATSIARARELRELGGIATKTPQQQTRELELLLAGVRQKIAALTAPSPTGKSVGEYGVVGRALQGVVEQANAKRLKDLQDQEKELTDQIAALAEQVKEATQQAKDQAAALGVPGVAAPGAVPSYSYDPTANVPNYYPNFDPITQPLYEAMEYAGQTFDLIEGDTYALAEALYDAQAAFDSTEGDTYALVEALYDAQAAFDSAEGDTYALAEAFRELERPFSSIMADAKSILESGRGSGGLEEAARINAKGKSDPLFETHSFVEALEMAVQSITSLQLIMDPWVTMLTAAVEILGPLIDSALAPLVGILVVLGQLLGNMLAPVIQLLAPIIELVGQAFVWLYNNVLLPVGNVIIGLFVGIATFVKGVMNAIIWAVNPFLRKSREIAYLDMTVPEKADWALTPIDIGSLTAAGAGAISGAGSSYTSGSTTTVEHQPDIYIYQTFNGPVIGDGGGKEIGRSVAGWLEDYAGIGGKIHIEEAIT